MEVRERSTGVALEWTTREEPLPAVAVAGQGEVARRLGQRLLALDDAQLAQLRGVCAIGELLILGAADALPWVPGVSYLGHEPGSSTLLLPTTHAPTFPVVLLEKALRSRFPAVPPPLAVLAGSRQVLSVREARVLQRDPLERWLKGEP